MRIVRALFSISVLATAVAGHCQASLTEVSANTIIPSPPPSAPLSMWRAVQGRETLLLNRNGVALRGFRYAGKKADAPTIVFFNGNAMAVAGADLLYRCIAALGPTVVVYDYRGYGFSAGTADLTSFRSDGLAIYDETAKTAPGHRVIAYGFSMGTAVAAYVATQKAVAATILAAPIAAADEEFPVFARALGYPAWLIALMHPASDAQMIFAEARMMAGSKAPLLVLHGTADNLVPIAQGKEIFAASPAQTKKFVALRDVEHKDTAVASDSLQAIREFLASL
jgi:pimeloyl-ACP methyl ester carboxylesterase